MVTHRWTTRLVMGTLQGLLGVWVATGVAGASGSDWLDWRGPAHSRWANASELPVEWSDAEGVTRNIAWKTPLPARSGATPIVASGRVFLNVGEGEELELWALDAATGEVLWQRPLGTGNERKHKQNLSSPSPVSDGENVWVLTGTGVLAGFTAEGKQLWRRELQEEYGAFGLNWGYASSPLLHDGAVYVQVLHGFRTDEPSYLLAVDANTGGTRWRVERPTDARAESPDSYTTPGLLRRGAGELVISGGDYVTGHALDDGRELWRVGGLNPEQHGMYRIVASPVVIGKRIFVPSRVRPLIALEATGGYGTKPEKLWELDRGTDVPTPAASAEYLFVLNDRGILRRLDAQTGKETWDEPKRLEQGTYSASPLLGDGRLYATSEEGVTTVVAEYGDFQQLAVNRVDGFTLSSLAAVDGALFLRTETAIYRIEATP